MTYVLSDLVFVAILYQLSLYIEHPSLPWFAPYILWPIYWACQGCVMTGLWVCAHECGHRAFSDNLFFGDCVGLVLHSSLLVPYQAWKISHAKHHRSTNDMANDEVFIPPTRSEMGEVVALSGPIRLLHIAKMLLFGWPAHLWTHATGRKYPTYTNHFDPRSPLFLPHQRVGVVIGDIALIVVVATLYQIGATMGFGWLALRYGVPYLIVNFWLVLITDLQHTDLAVPHYRGEEWTWIKGALCTVDRDYGFLNRVFHHIGDTHVAHHLFSTIPHYHAQEVTDVLKPILGKYYVKDSASPGLRGIAQALWNTTTYCRFVEDSGNVLWFKHK
jgi:omega-6 fatty acid desaturase / acyl-lipid omega-6 desaturase (Delta-12 desaturase)